MSQYSERDEEPFILSYFAGRGPGYFVDIGALDGVRLSNTRALAELGWCGVCVEPHPESFARLVENVRPFDGRVQACGCAITPSVGQATLWMDLGEPARSSLVERHIGQFIVRERHPVPVRTVTPGLLMAMCNIPHSFEFLSIDAELYDESILRVWPLTLSTPELIMVEAMHDPGMERRVGDYLDERGMGYRRVWGNCANTAWAKGA